MAALLVATVACVKTEPPSERPRKTEFIFEGNVNGRVIDAQGTVVAAPDVTREEYGGINPTSFDRSSETVPLVTLSVNERGEEDTYVAQIDVAVPGEVRIYIETERKGGVGVPGSWTRPDTVARATFVQQLPAGAHLEIAVRTGQAPADLRLRIDEDGDGIFEAEVAPDEVETGDDLDHLPIFGIVNWPSGNER